MHDRSTEGDSGQCGIRFMIHAIWPTYLFGRNAQNIHVPQIQIDLLFPV